MPIETNTLYSLNSKLTPLFSSYLGFKLNFGLMPLYYLSYIISFIDIVKIVVMGKNLNVFLRILGIQGARETNNERDFTFFWGSLVALNKDKYSFHWNKWLLVAKQKNTQVVFAFLSLLLLRLLFSWFQVYHMQWKPSEISKDLQKKGIYLDGIRPGYPTQNLLKKVINKLIFFWFFFIIIPLNLVFDNLGFAENNRFDFSFTGWFNSVSIGTNLIRQVRTKYKYIQVNK